MALFFEGVGVPLVGLFDEDDVQLFETVGILDVAVSNSNTFAEHTLEDGKVVVDNKIINRVPITVSAILSPDNFDGIYKKIRESDKNNVKFKIQTRVDTFYNMYIESYTHSENSKIANTIAISINFIEQQFVEVKQTTLPSQKVKNPVNADPVDTGEKLPVESSTTLLDFLESTGIL